MHTSISRPALVTAVKGVTNCTWIGLIGSAAHAAKDFHSDSDIDVIAVHPHESRFIWDTFAGRELEVHEYATHKLDQLQEHPEWFGVDWVWEIGKINEAEHLDGDRPTLAPGAKSRTVAILAALGKILIALKKHQQGRAPTPRVAHELTALRCLVDGHYPLRFTDDPRPVDVDYIDNARTELEGVMFAQLEQVIFFPEHRAAAEHLIQRWSLGVKVPDRGTAF
jgi:hypothetical protein